MASSPPGGALRLFSFRGIRVYVHWSWAVVAMLELQLRSDEYSSLAWNAAEYLALFGLVLLHEFGHALACRSVGGQAEQILLWPLGGVAYVRPPQRPGAQLWSIAAGPLVNLALLPVTLLPLALLQYGYISASPDVFHALMALTIMNGLLFAFNILPIYPLDGGQILRALLWFFVGPYRSLAVAAGIGLVASLLGGTALVAATDSTRGKIFAGFLAVYAAWRSVGALRVARMYARIHREPRRPTARCPSCGQAPPVGPYWRCADGHAFDAFETRGACPDCADGADGGVSVPCVFCGEPSPLSAYLPAQTAVWADEQRVSK